MTQQIIEETNPKPGQPAFWTTRELGNRWRLRPRTIQKYAAHGKIESTKIGGRHRIPDSAVQSLEARRVGRHHEPTKSQDEAATVPAEIPETCTANA
jgi:hypothetical protein